MPGAEHGHFVALRRGKGLFAKRSDSILIVLEKAVSSDPKFQKMVRFCSKIFVFDVFLAREIRSCFAEPLIRESKLELFFLLLFVFRFFSLFRL